MAWFKRSSSGPPQGEALRIENLNGHYGRAHALQDVSITLDHGVLAVVGRNGMGKTTLCNAITGLVPSTGTIRVHGQAIHGLNPNQVTARGVAYVPQGRRVWPSLSVDEHLRLVAKRDARWNIERVYTTFPRLAERKGNGGAQLSGGEQQMLAIARALLLDPQLLVMDEPTEGLAPVIVQQVADMLRTLAAQGDISVLLIEQNLGVAMSVADDIAVMVNGRIVNRMPASQLAADTDLQQRLLGVKSGGHSEEPDEIAGIDAPGLNANTAEDDAQVRVFTIKRAADADTPAGPSMAPGPGNDTLGSTLDNQPSRTVRSFNRWNSADPSQDAPRDRLLEGRSTASGSAPDFDAASEALSASGKLGRVVEFPVAASLRRAAYVVGTFDTKGKELFYLRNCLEKLGLRAVTVDVSTSGKPSPAMVHPREIARYHPKGERAVFTGDRGSAVSEMAVALEHFVLTRHDLGGMLSAGGSGGTALVSPAMRALSIGVPKMMVSSVASGDVKPYVGPSDICMMYSVTDVSGINRISEKVLANAAHAMAGMLAYSSQITEQSHSKQAIALSMFGVTTPCVQAAAKQLEERYDCLVFHATGTGGQSMEKLVDSGLISGVLDITTTEVCDDIVGGVLTAGPERFDAIIRTRVPYVASCGALDMVNFWAYDTVPAKFQGRNLYKHNANVTLMRTTLEECQRIGRFIVDKLNRMDGPVRFLIPDKGVSALDQEGKPFWDPAADKALFDVITQNFKTGPRRKLIRLPLHLNDPEFSDALVMHFNEVMAESKPNSYSSSKDSAHASYRS